MVFANSLRENTEIRNQNLNASFANKLCSLVTVCSTLYAYISSAKRHEIRQREDSRTGRHWPLSRRWEYTLEVRSRWPKENLTTWVS